jgi:hypothetical protein
VYAATPADIENRVLEYRASESMESNLRMVAAPCVERKRQMTLRNNPNDVYLLTILVGLSTNEIRPAGILPAGLQLFALRMFRHENAATQS